MDGGLRDPLDLASAVAAEEDTNEVWMRLVQAIEQVKPGARGLQVVV
ncbi:MAG TPA: hypothetical protein VM327_01230 [Candidatus Thermoplasmatota archaeon]|nr:hypothetical protein [Candidatus Thermoplasmatota archaeon]